MQRALTIAGSDSGGGAGIQADLKTFSALRVYGASAITALTAQNTRGVFGVLEVDPEFVGRQIDVVLEDIGADAVKIGMLKSARIVEVVAERLKRHRARNIVLDPVMVAKGGASLLEEKAIESLKRELFPIARIVAPNLPEASALLERSVEGRDQIEEAARALLKLGPVAVLIKGGHLGGASSADCLVMSNENGSCEGPIWFECERIETKNCHGTGCTLSSAIAAFLAKGFELRDSVQRAKGYITAALRSGRSYSIGGGHGPLFL